MKRSKIFFKLVQKDNGDVFCNGVHIKPFGENIISIKDEEYDLNLIIHTYFTNTKLTTKFMDKAKKLTVFNIVERKRFYSVKANKASILARMEDAWYTKRNS